MAASARFFEHIVDDTDNVAFIARHARGRDRDPPQPRGLASVRRMPRAAHRGLRRSSGMPSPSATARAPSPSCASCTASPDPPSAVSPPVDTVDRVGHIELRDLDDDDLDAIFEMMRDRAAVEMAAFTAADPDDRDGVRRVDRPPARGRRMSRLYVVTENGGFAGTAALFSVDGDREVTYWIARHAWGRGVATEALRLLVSREPERPLFARVAAHNAASIAVLDQGGLHRGLARRRLRSGRRARDRGDRAGAGADAGVATEPRGAWKRRMGPRPGALRRFVREGGVEPPRPFGHWHLKPARLPIPPLARDAASEDARNSTSRGYHAASRAPESRHVAHAVHPTVHQHRLCN